MKNRLTVIGFLSGILFATVLNVVQVVVAMSATTGDAFYGLPFTFYEYLVNFNRGRFVGYGLIGDVAFALILSGIFAAIFRRFRAIHI